MSDHNQPLELISRAEELFGAGQIIAARNLLEAALNLDPGQAEAHNDLGVILTELGELAEALVHYQEAVRLKPLDQTFLKNLAEFRYAAFNDAAGALKLCLDLIAAWPDDTEAYILAGDICRDAGQHANAQGLYLKALALRPDDLDLAERLAELKRLERRGQNRSQRIQIISPSDRDPDEERRQLWGDHWLKVDLAREFERRGLTVVDQDADVIIAFIGLPLPELPREAFKIAWLYSHPDLLDYANLRQFDKIFCMSPSFIPKLEAMGYRNVEVLIGATSKTPLERKAAYDIVFVGNSRGRAGRQIVTDIGATAHNFKVWGNDWDGILDSKYFAGRYFANEELNELYAAALISITDHHADMAREGFVSVKIFDILASGGFAISDENSGIAAIFGDSVPQYRSPEHFKELLDHYIAHPQERAALMERGRAIALRHNFAMLADRLLAAVAANGRPQHGGATTTVYVDLFNADNSNLHWLRAFKAAGATVPFDIREIYLRGLGKVAEDIIALKPNHIHLGGSVKDGMLPPSVLQYIKNLTGCTVSAFYGDARPSVYHEDLGPVADRIYISNKTHIGQAEARGFTNYRYLPCPTDPEIFRPHKLEQVHDLCFIGNNNNTSRLELLKRIAARYELVAVGNGWETTSFKHLPACYGAGFAQICSQSKIMLSLMGDEWAGLSAYFSNRLINTLACGAFLIQRYTPGLETVFENRRQLVWYETEDELYELIAYYLEHADERRAIALQGRAEAIDRYTYAKSVAAILDASRGFDNPDLKEEL